MAIVQLTANRQVFMIACDCIIPLAEAHLKRAKCVPNRACQPENIRRAVACCQQVERLLAAGDSSLQHFRAEIALSEAAARGDRYMLPGLGLLKRLAKFER